MDDNFRKAFQEVIALSKEFFPKWEEVSHYRFAHQLLSVTEQFIAEKSKTYAWAPINDRIIRVRRKLFELSQELNDVPSEFRDELQIELSGFFVENTCEEDNRIPLHWVIDATITQLFSRDDEIETTTFQKAIESVKPIGRANLGSVDSRRDAYLVNFLNCCWSASGNIDGQEKNKIQVSINPIRHAKLEGYLEYLYRGLILADAVPKKLHATKIEYLETVFRHSYENSDWIQSLNVPSGNQE